MAQSPFDPWGPISSVLYEIRDSDFVKNAVGRTGLRVIWHPHSKDEAYSHSTRIRAFARDIDVAYSQLSEDHRGHFAQIIVKAMLSRRDGEELREALTNVLSDIGWAITAEGLLVTQDALIAERFFPPNSEFDAFVTIRDILASAKSTLTIVDGYVGATLLTSLRAVAHASMAVRLLTVQRNLKPDFFLEASTFLKQFPRVALEVRATADFHDRFIVVDSKEIFHLGASIKDAGKRAFMISRISDKANFEGVDRAIAQSWADADVLPV